MRRFLGGWQGKATKPPARGVASGTSRVEDVQEMIMPRVTMAMRIFGHLVFSRVHAPHACSEQCATCYILSPPHWCAQCTKEPIAACPHA